MSDRIARKGEELLEQERELPSWHRLVDVVEGRSDLVFALPSCSSCEAVGNTNTGPTPILPHRSDSPRNSTVSQVRSPIPATTGPDSSWSTLGIGHSKRIPSGRPTSNLRMGWSWR